MLFLPLIDAERKLDNLKKAHFWRLAGMESLRAQDIESLDREHQQRLASLEMRHQEFLFDAERGLAEAVRAEDLGWLATTWSSA